MTSRRVLPKPKDRCKNQRLCRRRRLDGNWCLGLGASVTILIASSVLIMPRWRSHLRWRPPNPFSMMTQPMRPIPADASAARANDNGRDVLADGYDHKHSGAPHVTSWSNTSIQMQFRAVDGSSIRFAQSEETTGPR